MQMNRVIVVLGMHRSGTSAITRGLQALGVELGDDLLPPVAEDNDKGYFEGIAINQLNIELLNALGSNWDDLSYIPEEAFAHRNIALFRSRAADMLRTKMMNGRPFGMKDPRVSRLLPFWQSVFTDVGLVPSYAIVVRNPMSVVRSLASGKRGDIDHEQGYYLWLEHMVPSIISSAGEERIVVDFDQFMAAPLPQLERLAQGLRLPFDSSSAAVKEYTDEFLDSKLQHTKFTLEDLRTGTTIPPEIATAYKALLRLARDEAALDSAESEKTFRQLDAALREHFPLLDYRPSLKRSGLLYHGWKAWREQGLGGVKRLLSRAMHGESRQP